MKKNLLLFVAGLALLFIQSPVFGQINSREINTTLMVNQIGFRPESPKYCISPGTTKTSFEVIRVSSGKTVYSGTLLPVHGDFGSYLKAEFSVLKDEGQYYLKTNSSRSYPFTISDSIYSPMITLIAGYFSRQRCGASSTGYFAPCHTDDGVRIDNGIHQDVSGGWHDASDLRKWVGATIYGMIGLAKTYELQKGPLRARLLDELIWGNRYFLRMQEPAGYVMSFVGGDVRKHSDSNRWTDNDIGQEGGELKFVSPNAGSSKTPMLVFGNKDDRVIETAPLDRVGQFNFISAEAMMSRITKSGDPDYAQKCLQAAEKCFQYVTGQKIDSTAVSLGAAIHAALEMFKTTGLIKYKSFAVKSAAALQTLQVTDEKADLQGFFFNSFKRDEPSKEIWQGCIGFIAIADLCQAFPDHADLPRWKQILRLYGKNYLSELSKRNAFSIVPFGLFTSDPGSARKAGRYWYRYFMKPELDWWVGINSNLASAGVGLVKAARILQDKEMLNLGQEQLDWIAGVNPFASSTIIGVGRNHPVHFQGESFTPSTPIIPGAVMNGLGGTENDEPSIGHGDWQISEYWTPMVSYTLWLIAELSVK